MIVHVLDSMADEASGPSYSVPRLCKALADAGEEVRLLTIGETLRTAGFTHEGHPQDYASLPVARRLRFSRSLRSAINRDAVSADLLHMHGLWLMSNIYPAQAAHRAGKPLVISPRGMLGPAALGFSKRKKKLFWALAQGRVARNASCIHATSMQEYEEVRAFGLDTPVAVIPNGIEVPEAEHSNRPRERVVLFLGRLHPKKGLDQLLEAWRAVAGRHPGWRLHIVGPIDSAYAESLHDIVATMPRTRMIGPLYGSEKAAAYREATVFVLPTLNENFAMTVAEALAQGTPVISTKGAPWAGLEQNGCGWWIDHGAESLAAALEEACSMEPESLALMGEAGRVWMHREFDWTGIGARMQAVYRWLEGNGTRPSDVLEH